MAKDFSKAKASSTLKSVAEKSKMLGNTKVIIKLPIDKLIDHPDNEYLFGMKQEDIDHMAEGIAKNGFKDPIEVYDNQDGTYLIYSGHIRKYGAVKNGMTDIDAIVYDKPEENVIRRELLGANLFGRNRIDNSDPILVARQLEYHTETLHMEGFLGNRRKQVAKEFGFKSDANVHKYIALLSLIPELQKKVSERIVSYSGISAAAQMTEEEQEQLNELLEQKLEYDTVTRAELENMIKEIRKGEEEQVEGQMNVTDYPEMVPEEKEADYTEIADASEETVMKEDKTTVDIYIEPEEEESIIEEASRQPEQVRQVSDGEYTNEEAVDVNVVHGEQSEISETEEKQKSNLTDNKDSKYNTGEMLNVYIKHIQKIFENNDNIKYKDVKDTLGKMKVLKMMLEDEIDRLSELTE